MLQRITKRDPIWNAPPFSSEKAAFSLLFSLREYDDPLIVTDRKTIFAVQTSPDMPAWVWTHADVNPEIIHAFCSAYKIRKMTAKHSLMRMLDGQWKATHHLLAYVCNNQLIFPHVDGFLDRPDTAELPQIAQGVASFHEEALRETISGGDAMKAAQSHLLNNDFAVWRTDSHELTAFASIRHWTEEYARISMVYTFPRFRGKGYAGAVVSALCAKIIAQGVTPMLYTNAFNLSSNRAYQKIGFNPVGELATFCIFQ